MCTWRGLNHIAHRAFADPPVLDDFEYTDWLVGLGPGTPVPTYYATVAITDKVATIDLLSVSTEESDDGRSATFEIEAEMSITADMVASSMVCTFGSPYREYAYPGTTFSPVTVTFSGTIDVDVTDTYTFSGDVTTDYEYEGHPTWDESDDGCIETAFAAPDSPDIDDFGEYLEADVVAWAEAFAEQLEAADVHAIIAVEHDSKARGGEWEPVVVNGERHGPGYIACIWYISPGTPVARKELLPLVLFAVECLEGPIT